MRLLTAVFIINLSHRSWIQGHTPAPYQEVIECRPPVLGGGARGSRGGFRGWLWTIRAIKAFILGVLLTGHPLLYASPGKTSGSCCVTYERPWFS